MDVSNLLLNSVLFGGGRRLALCPGVGQTPSGSDAKDTALDGGGEGEGVPPLVRSDGICATTVDRQ